MKKFVNAEIEELSITETLSGRYHPEVADGQWEQREESLIDPINNEGPGWGRTRGTKTASGNL